MTRASNGHGSVFRSPDGQRWEGCASLGTNPDTGKRERKHVRGRTKAEVQAKIDDAIRHNEPGVVRIDPRTTLTQWLELWVQRRTPHVRPSTLSGYSTDLLYVRKSGIGQTPLKNVSGDHIEALYDWVLATGRSTGTTAHLHRTLNAALRRAVKLRHLTRNPLDDVQVPHSTTLLDRPYDFGEIARLVSVARTRRNGVRWEIALLGLRQGEALGLSWTDVDLERGQLTISRSLTWLQWQHGCDLAAGSQRCGRAGRWCPARWGGGPRLGPTKNHAGSRVISLPEPLRVRLAQHKEAQEGERRAAGPAWQIEWDLVIASRTGGPIDRTTDREDWLDVVTATGLRRLRVHDLRHTAATALLVLGEDSRTLMDVMGWSSVSLVQRYAHIVPAVSERVATRQASFLALPGDTHHSGRGATSPLSPASQRRTPTRKRR